MPVYYHHGAPLMADYTPGTAKVAGEVVVVGEENRIVHSDIEANQLGAIALPCGSAIYRGPKSTAASSGWNDGVLLYWDDTNDQVTKTASTHKKLGYAVGPTVDADTYGYFRHAT